MKRRGFLKKALGALVCLPSISLLGKSENEPVDLSPWGDAFAAPSWEPGSHNSGLFYTQEQGVLMYFDGKTASTVCGCGHVTTTDEGIVIGGDITLSTAHFSIR